MRPLFDTTAKSAQYSFQYVYTELSVYTSIYEVCHLVTDPDMSIIIALHGNLHGTFTDLHGLR
jgi:hypothetical protein